MKSLLDIQQDVRSLEKKLTEVTEALKTLNSDLEALRNVDRKVGGIDFTKIELLAKQLPFKNHPIRKLKDKSLCRLYLEMLLNLVRLDGDEKAKIDRLIFVQWLKTEAKNETNLEKVFQKSYKLDMDSFEQFISKLPNSYKKIFAADMLVLANIGGGSEEIYNYIADWLGMLKIEVEELEMIIKVIRFAFRGNKEKNRKRKVTYKFLKYVNEFSYYFTNEDLIKKFVIKEGRVLCEVEKDDVIDFKFKVDQFSKVKKNTVLATYKLKKWEKKGAYQNNSGIVEVRADGIGYVSSFPKKKKLYIVIADEEKYLKDIVEWVKK